MDIQNKTNPKMSYLFQIVYSVYIKLSANSETTKNAILWINDDGKKIV